jgi:7-cyano-7-deazaguanine synthase in queuosine biosynthesis
MILLFSGGVDSFIAYHFLNKPKTLYLDLGTPYSEKEIEFVKKVDPNIIIDRNLGYLGEMQQGEKAYIPFRNMLMAAHAVRYSDTVVIAGLKDDQVSDKNEEIFKKFSDIFSEMEGRMILVHSPFWGYTKSDIVKWFLEFAGTENQLLETVSCYSPDNTNYCGKCPCCFRKWVAFWNNGIQMDFYNDDLMDEYYKSATTEKYIPDRNLSIMVAIDAYRS